MAHELTKRANGFIEMAFVGNRADIWHGLGQELAPDSSIEEWQVAAGMDWRIQRSKVRYFTSRDGAEQHEMPGQHVLFRSDTKAPLSIVSDSYHVVQPRENLDFFRDLVGENGFELSAAGTLFGGRKFWATAQIGEAANIVAGDRVGGFLLLATSCDGTMPTIGKFVMTRAVCNNTVTAALGEQGKQVKASHRQEFNPQRMKDALGIATGAFGKMIGDMRRLAQIPVDRQTAETLVRNILRPVETAPTTDAFQSMMRGIMAPIDEKARAPKGEAEILRLFSGEGMGAGLPGVQGTAWGLLNAFTQYVDHNVTAKTPSHRMQSAWFDKGDELKTRAMDSLMALAH